MYQPVLAVICGAMAVFVGLIAVDSKTGSNIVFKTRLAFRGLLQMMLCKDMKIKKMPDADMDDNIFAEGITKWNLKKKRIIFIRHGESEWNNMFNRGFGPTFPVRVLQGLAREVISLPRKDSVFLDSPLSSRGYQQAKELQMFLKEPPQSAGDAALKDIGSIIKGHGLLVTSNLRRACETVSVGLLNRLKLTSEPVYMLSMLQEFSRNVDTISLAPDRKPHPPESLSKLKNHIEKPLTVGSIFDGEYQHGNKPIRASGSSRLRDFAQWAIDRPENLIVVTGHSGWFKCFFKALLPTNFEHKCKKRKIQNCGVVGFTLARVRGEVGKDDDLFRILPESLTTIYKGYS